MTNNDIYAILASKPHNPHYLKRYFKFIQWCQENPTTDEYVEDHHICPKADDLFPEYADLKKFVWNSITLTSRQHFISHFLLWKAYGGSQSYAFKRFCDGAAPKHMKREDNHRISSKTYEILKKSAIAYTSKIIKGTVTYRNKVTGESGRIKKEDFESNDLLVGASYMKRGRKDTDTTRKNKSKPKSKEHADKIKNALISRQPVVCCIVTRKEFICSAWGKYVRMMYEKGHRENLSKKFSDAKTGIAKTQAHKNALSIAKKEKNKINRVCVIETQKEMTTQQFLRNETIKARKL